MSGTDQPSRFPTWEERTGGIQFVDDMGRRIQVRVSRFHGPIITVGNESAYLGATNAETLIDYLKENI